MSEGLRLQAAHPGWGKGVGSGQVLDTLGGAGLSFPLVLLPCVTWPHVCLARVHPPHLASSQAPAVSPPLSSVPCIEAGPTRPPFVLWVESQQALGAEWGQRWALGSRGFHLIQVDVGTLRAPRKFRRRGEIRRGSQKWKSSISFIKARQAAFQFSFQNRIGCVHTACGLPQGTEQSRAGD